MTHYHVVTKNRPGGNNESNVYRTEFIAKIQYAFSLQQIRLETGTKENYVGHAKDKQIAEFPDGSSLEIYECDADCLEIVKNED